MSHLVDAGGKEQFEFVGAVHLHRLVEVTPLVASGVRHVDAHAASAPDSPDHWQQARAMFVEHPQPHPLTQLGRLSRDGRQFLRQCDFERRGLGRIFFSVALARHLQLPPKPSQHLADTAIAQRLARAFLDPRLRVLGAAELIRATKKALPFREVLLSLHAPGACCQGGAIVVVVAAHYRISLQLSWV